MSALCGTDGPPARLARAARAVRCQVAIFSTKGSIVSEGIFATLHTNAGPIRVELFPNHAPKTVRNFVELAEGSREYTNPRTGQPGRGPYYDGTIFHRIISGFMIPGGDPTGTGTGGPGYTFEDEFNEHKIERGALAMANAGPNTNGSQFFVVTTDAAPWLDGKHTVFGRVT